MAYSDFTLDLVEQRLGVVVEYANSLFEGLAEAAPSPELARHLSRWASEAKAINTESAQSALIVTPIIVECVDHVRQTGRPATLLMGTSFEVDKSRGLTGTCDFLLTRSPSALTLHRPVLAIVEAKKDDLQSGVGQCAAAMVAAREFNQTDMTITEPPPTAIHGAVTTGDVWRFLRLDASTLRVDRTEYFLVQLPKILGILRAILS